MTHSELERELEKKGRELMRKLLQEHLDNCSPGQCDDAPVLGADLELENWVRHRLLEIFRGKAGLMAGGMRRSATRRGLSATVREPVDTCARYLPNHSAYLQYNRCLAQGLPVATGVIGGACRHLVKDRMEVTDARWSLNGAEAVFR